MMVFVELSSEHSNVFSASGAKCDRVWQMTLRQRDRECPRATGTRQPLTPCRAVP
jgi:hypothetical protein